nr:hypothetical protein [Bacillus velezensis]
MRQFRRSQAHKVLSQASAMVGYNPAPQQTIVQNDNAEEIKSLKEQNETLNTKLDAMITLLTRLVAKDNNNYMDGRKVDQVSADRYARAAFHNGLR